MKNIKHVKKKQQQVVRRESENIVNEFLQEVMRYSFYDRFRLAWNILKANKEYKVKRVVR